MYAPSSKDPSSLLHFLAVESKKTYSFKNTNDTGLLQFVSGSFSGQYSCINACTGAYLLAFVCAHRWIYKLYFTLIST